MESNDGWSGLGFDDGDIRGSWEDLEAVLKAERLEEIIKKLGQVILDDCDITGDLG